MTSNQTCSLTLQDLMASSSSPMNKDLQPLYTLMVSLKSLANKHVRKEYLKRLQGEDRLVVQKIVKSADPSEVKPAVFERIYNKMVKQVLIPHKKRTPKKDGLTDMIRKAYDI